MAMVSVSQLSTAMNVSPRRVQQLVALGLPRPTRGRYDLGPCLMWFIRHLTATLKDRTQGEDGSVSTLTAARSQVARGRAEQLHAANMKARHEVVLLESLRPQLGQALTIARQETAAIATKSTTNPETRAAIQREVDAINERLAARLEAIGKPKGDGSSN